MSVDIRELHKNNSSGKTFKGVKWIAIGAAAILVAVNSFTIVPAGNTGVVLTLGKVSETSYQEGFHLKIPFIQQVEDMSNKIQVYETPLRLFQRTSRQSAVKLPLTIDCFRIKPQVCIRMSE